MLAHRWTDASVCDDGDALIGGQCDLATDCILSENNRRGYNATMKDVRCTDSDVVQCGDVDLCV